MKVRFHFDEQIQVAVGPRLPLRAAAKQNDAPRIKRVHDRVYNFRNQRIVYLRVLDMFQLLRRHSIEI